MSKNFELMQKTAVRLQMGPTTDPCSIPQLGLAKEEDLYETIAGPLARTIHDEVARLVQQLFLLKPEASPRVVMFAGIDHGNGCSVVCSEAAGVLATSVRGSICIVETNFASPTLSRDLGHLGLTDALIKDGPIREFATLVSQPNLWLISSGSLNHDSRSLLQSERLQLRLTEIRESFDYIFLDAPPLNEYMDGTRIAKMADGVVLVLEAGTTRRETAKKIAGDLRANQILILAAVLNKRTLPIPESLYRKL